MRNSQDTYKQAMKLNTHIDVREEPDQPCVVSQIQSTHSASAGCRGYENNVS